MKYVIILSVIALLSCNRTDKKFESKTVYEINIESAYNKSGDIHISDVADTISYIPLETNDACLIKSIGQIELSRDYIFVSQLRSVFQFDRKGKFIRQVGSLGRGPGEYSQIRNISIEPQSNILYINCAPGQKILKYNFDGVLLQSLDVSLYSVWSLPFGNDKYIFHYPDVPFEQDICDYLYFFTDTLGHILKKVERIDKIKVRDFIGIGQFNLYALGQDYMFKDLHNDTIFKVSYESLTPHIILNFGKYKLDKNIGTGSMEIQKSLEKYLLALNIVESQNYVFLTFSHGYGGKIISGLYKKQEDNFMVNNISERRISGLINDIDGALPFFPKSYDNESGNLVMYYSATRLIEFMRDPVTSNSNSINNNDNSGLRSIVTNLDYSDNPVIGLVRLR